MRFDGRRRELINQLQARTQPDGARIIRCAAGLKFPGVLGVGISTKGRNAGSTEPEGRIECIAEVVTHPGGGVKRELSVRWRPLSCRRAESPLFTEGTPSSDI